MFPLTVRLALFLKRAMEKQTACLHFNEEENRKCWIVCATIPSARDCRSGHWTVGSVGVNVTAERLTFCGIRTGFGLLVLTRSP